MCSDGIVVFQKSCPSLAQSVISLPHEIWSLAERSGHEPAGQIGHIGRE